MRIETRSRGPETFASSDRGDQLPEPHHASPTKGGFCALACVSFRASAVMAAGVAGSSVTSTSPNSVSPLAGSPGKPTPGSLRNLLQRAAGSLPGAVFEADSTAKTAGSGGRTVAGRLGESDRRSSGHSRGDSRRSPCDPIGHASGGHVGNRACRRRCCVAGASRDHRR
jgi:hypothetical protein